MAEETRPWEQDVDGGSFGSWLRRQREARDIGLREISSASKISIRYLEALEEDRFEVLPASVFVRGFLREYAKIVGLDPDEVVNSYLVVNPDEEDEDSSTSSPVAPERSNTQIWTLLAVVALLLAIVASFSFWSRQRGNDADELPGIVPPSPAAEVAPDSSSSQPAEPSASPLILTMDFNQNSWVVVFIDGERTVSELRVQGESLRVEAASEIRVTLGNFAGVSFELNGQPYPVDGGDDEEVVIDLSSTGEGSADSANPGTGEL